MELQLPQLSVGWSTFCPS